MLMMCQRCLCSVAEMFTDISMLTSYSRRPVLSPHTTLYTVANNLIAKDVTLNLETVLEGSRQFIPMKAVQRHFVAKMAQLPGYKTTWIFRIMWPQAS